MGFRPDAFTAFWQRVEAKPDLLTIEMFRGTPLEQVLNERVALDPGDSAISTLIKLKDRADAEKLRDLLPGMIVLDHRGFADHIANMAKDGLGKFALWTGIIVTGLVFFSLAYTELTIITMLPLAFGLFWTFGAMGLLGVPIDLMNSIFVIFILGVGEDYSVFLMFGNF